MCSIMGANDKPYSHNLHFLPPYHKYYKYNLNGLDTYFMNDVQPTFQNKN